MSEQQETYTRSHENMQEFVATWEASGGAERANYQMVPLLTKR